MRTDGESNALSNRWCLWRLILEHTERKVTVNERMNEWMNEQLNECFMIPQYNYLSYWVSEKDEWMNEWMNVLMFIDTQA